MELQVGQAVFFESAENLVTAAYVETASADWFQGKELAVITDLAEGSSKSMEVLLTGRLVFGLRSQVRRVAKFCSREEYSGLPQGCLWRRRIAVQTETSTAVSGLIRSAEDVSAGETGEIGLLQDVSEQGRKRVIAEPEEETLRKSRKTQGAASSPSVAGSACEGFSDVQSEVQTEEVPGPRKDSARRDKTEPESPRKSTLLHTARYKLLTTDQQISLQRVVHLLECESERLRGRLNGEELLRQNFKDRVMAALLLSEHEQRSQGESVDLYPQQLTKIAIRIEEELLIQSKYRPKSSEYTSQARMLVFNLLDPNNPETRQKLLRGQITPERIARMKAADLASSSAKKQRKDMEKQHIEEKVISADIQSKLIVKSHKGEGVLDLAAAHEVNEGVTDMVAALQERCVNPPQEQPADEELHQVPIASPFAPAPKPWVPPQLYELAQKCSPELLSASLRKRIIEFLPDAQAKKILRQTNLA